MTYDTEEPYDDNDSSGCGCLVMCCVIIFLVSLIAKYVC
jgi:hypothetical protein